MPLGMDAVVSRPMGGTVFVLWLWVAGRGLQWQWAWILVAGAGLDKTWQTLGV